MCVCERAIGQICVSLCLHNLRGSLEGLFSKWICVIVLCLYLGQCLVLSVSLSCPTGCLLAFKLFIIGQIKMDGWMVLKAKGQKSER